MHPVPKENEVTERATLHLVDDEGAAVNSEVREAVEKAFHWVAREFPNLDPAPLADWAEALAKSMHLRGSGIDEPERYAYVALKGKVRDSLRKRSAQEQPHGIGRDLERIGGSSATAQADAERQILWNQLGAALSERDKQIHFLLGRQDSAQEIAVELNIAYPAARKAIQRVRERIDAFVGRPRKEEDKVQPISAWTKEV